MTVVPRHFFIANEDAFDCMVCIFFVCIAAMSNQELVDHGHKMMDETDQSIERSKQVGFLPLYHTSNGANSLILPAWSLT